MKQLLISSVMREHKNNKTRGVVLITALAGVMALFTAACEPIPVNVTENEVTFVADPEPSHPVVDVVPYISDPSLGLGFDQTAETRARGFSLGRATCGWVTCTVYWSRSMTRHIRDNGWINIAAFFSLPTPLRVMMAGYSYWIKVQAGRAIAASPDRCLHFKYSKNMYLISIGTTSPSSTHCVP